MLPTRAPLPRPAGPLDPELEAAAARALEHARAKPVRRGGPPKAGAIVARVLPKGFKAGGRSVEALRRQWAAIVGDKLAQLTEPEKIVSAATGRVLTVKVAGPAAPFVQHQIPLLLERCNLAGADLAGVTLKQGAIARPKGNVRPLSAPLAADEERLLAAALAPVESDRLKAALLRIGRHVGQRPR